MCTTHGCRLPDFACDALQSEPRTRALLSRSRASAGRSLRATRHATALQCASKLATREGVHLRPVSAQDAPVLIRAEPNPQISDCRSAKVGSAWTWRSVAPQGVNSEQKAEYRPAKSSCQGPTGPAEYRMQESRRATVRRETAGFRLQTRTGAVARSAVEQSTECRAAGRTLAGAQGLHYMEEKTRIHNER